MHYYKFNIGDYAGHTRYLTPMQDLAYRRLLDFCYLHEKPIPKNNPAFAIGLEQHRTDVEHVLNTYFVLIEQGWTNKRAEREIDEYKSNAKAKSLAGIKSGEARRANKNKGIEQTLNTCLTNVELNSKHKTLNNNQETLTKKTTAKNIERPVGVLEGVWQDFVAQRKAKKSAITQTALNGIEREAKKANVSLNDALQEICARGWTGFKAEWVATNSNNKNESWTDKRRAWVAEATGQTQTQPDTDYTREPDVFEVAMAEARRLR